MYYRFAKTSMQKIGEMWLAANVISGGRKHVA